MSNFTRKISNMDALQNQLNTNGFLHEVNHKLIQNGRAFLAFRNDEATIYYNGNQLCSLSGSSGYEPTIYNHYLPITRSRTLASHKKKEPYSIEQWRKSIGSGDLSFESVINEILDNLEKESSPESLQDSRFYRFSPLNRQANHEIVLLDIEAAFSGTGEKTDRIDLVFYHKVDRRLMFVEVKRLSDSRLYIKSGTKGAVEAEVIGQLKSYKDRLDKKFQQINSQYSNVIDYYNALSGGNIPRIIPNSKPLFGLLLVEFSRSARDQERKEAVQEMIAKEDFKMYAIGNTANATKGSTIAAIYKAFK